MHTGTIVDSFVPLLDLAPCAGYLDPGTGSYALQLLLAGVFGGLFALKQHWQQGWAWLAGLRAGRGDAKTPFEPAD